GPGTCPRAVQRSRAGCGRVRAGGDPLRAARRPAAVQGRVGGGDLHQVIFQDPVAPSLLNPKAPRDLETICLKCLQKDATRRYVSAGALAEDLERYLRGAAIVARPEGRLARRVRQRKLLSAALAACVLFAIALVGVGLWFVSDRAAVEAERESAKW